MSPEAGRKFCFACKALTHIHRHTSEYSLTGVRKQSKLLHGCSNHPGGQRAGEAERAWYCSTCVPSKIGPAPGTPTNTHSHKEHKLPVTGTFPGGAMSYWGERTELKPSKMPPSKAASSILGHTQHWNAGRTEAPSPCGHALLLVLLLLFVCFHPLLLGGAVTINCPTNTGRVRGPFRSSTTRRGKWGTKRQAACWNLPLSWEDRV